MPGQMYLTFISHLQKLKDFNKKRNFKNKKIFFTGYSRFDKSNLDKRILKDLVRNLK